MIKMFLDECIIEVDKLYKCQFCGVTIERNNEAKSLFREFDCHLMTEHGSGVFTT